MLPKLFKAHLNDNPVMGIEDAIKGRFKLPSEQNLVLEILLNLESSPKILEIRLSDLQAHRCDQLLMRAGFYLLQGDQAAFKQDIYEALTLASREYKAQKGKCSFEAFPLSAITKGLFLLEHYGHLRFLLKEYQADL